MIYDENNDGIDNDHNGVHDAASDDSHDSANVDTTADDIIIGIDDSRFYNNDNCDDDVVVVISFFCIH